MAPTSQLKWNAELYDAKHAFVSEKGMGLVDLLAPRAGENILDLGCGTGTLTAQIASHGAETIGVDRSAEMVSEARKKFPALRFEVMDATRLAFVAQFDAVFSNAVLHWVREAERVAIGVERALKSGGRFVAEFGGKGNIRRLVDGMERACKVLGVPRASGSIHWYNPGISQYSTLLEAHGLEVRQAAVFDRPTRLEDGEKGLDNWLRMFATDFMELAKDARLELWIREVERQTRAELWKDGYWELDYRRLRIEAWKE